MTNFHHKLQTHDKEKKNFYDDFCNSSQIDVFRHIFLFFSE